MGLHRADKTGRVIGTHGVVMLSTRAGGRGAVAQDFKRTQHTLRVVR